MTESVDAGGDFDLTPLDRSGSSDSRRSRRGAWSAALLLGVMAALGFVLVRGLSDATLFFYNVDEAVDRRDELGDRNFRLQGEVVADSIREESTGTHFTVSHNSVNVDVEHLGGAPTLFQPGIPVVLEGHWDGDHFDSDRILVKHSEVYEAENPNRVSDYDDADNDDAEYDDIDADSNPESAVDGTAPTPATPDS